MSEKQYFKVCSCGNPSKILSDGIAYCWDCYEKKLKPKCTTCDNSGKVGWKPPEYISKPCPDCNKPDDRIREAYILFQNTEVSDKIYENAKTLDNSEKPTEAIAFISGYKSALSDHEKEIEELKFQLSGFKSQYNDDEKEIEELKHDLRQYKKHVNKLMERYNIKDSQGRLIEIQHHWFKNLIEWHKEATKETKS